MREIMRDYTATGKYKSENILGNQFMEEHEREFFDKNAFVLERQVALLAENYRSGQDDSLYDFIADLEEHEGEYVVDGALLTCTRCSKHARKVVSTKYIATENEAYYTIGYEHLCDDIEGGDKSIEKRDT